MFKMHKTIEINIRIVIINMIIVKIILISLFNKFVLKRDDIAEKLEAVNEKITTEIT